METKGYSEEFDLQKYWLVLRRRWLVVSGVFASAVVLSTLAASTQRPTYQANGKLLFQSSRSTSLTGVGERIGELESLKREGNPLDTQAEVVKSLPILQEVITSLNLKDQQGHPLNPELLTIKVDPIVGTDVLKVSYHSENAHLSAEVVNRVMNAFIANNLQTNRAEAISAGKFVEDQLPRAVADLEQAAEALRQFRTQNQIIDLDEELESAVTTIATLQDQTNQARTQLADVGAQVVELRRQVGLSADQAVDITALSQVPGVQEVLGDLQKVQSRLATEQTRFTAKTPQIKSLLDQEAALTRLLQQRVTESLGTDAQVAPGALQIGTIRQQLATSFVQLQVQRLGLEQKLRSLTDLQTGYRQRASILPTLEKREGDFLRRLSVAQKTYENLSTRLQETRIAENQKVSNARIIQSALVPNQPTGSIRRLYLAGGAFVGLLLGIAAAFLVDLIDRSVKTVKEAQTLFGYTLLGLIPKYDASGSPTLENVSPRVIATTTPRSMIHEAYQMLLANLKFTSLDKKVRTIVITSSVPREGKSEVTANLAATIAQAGKRVLLVDADMRYPGQHHLWGLVNTIGLSNVVVDQGEFSRAVQSVTPNLSILTAGVMPPNPLALLDSESMTALVELLRKQYDYVIFDTPPLAGTADAAVLGKLADGLLLVVHPGVADSSSVTAAKQMLARSEPNILGLVANGVNVKQEPDSYFYYSSSREQITEKASPVKLL
jgi:polysaccharide biosynthesis transport protein